MHDYSFLSRVIDWKLTIFDNVDTLILLLIFFYTFDRILIQVYAKIASRLTNRKNAALNFLLIENVKAQHLCILILWIW